MDSGDVLLVTDTRRGVQNPGPVGSDAISKHMVPELSQTTGGPADVAESLGVGKPPSYLVAEVL